MPYQEKRNKYIIKKATRVPSRALNPDAPTFKFTPKPTIDCVDKKNVSDNTILSKYFSKYLDKDMIVFSDKDYLNYYVILNLSNFLKNNLHISTLCLNNCMNLERQETKSLFREPYDNIKEQSSLISSKHSPLITIINDVLCSKLINSGIKKLLVFTQMNDMSSNILEEMSKNKSINELNLTIYEGNMSHPNDLTTNLDILFKNNKTLKTLRVRGLCNVNKFIPKMDDTNYLATNNTLDSLEFSYNTVMNESRSYMLKYIFRALLNNSITTVNLSYNYINNHELKYLMLALKNNTTVKHLDISYNLITSQGITYIADMLKTNTSLISLNLNNNLIDDLSVYFLGIALYGNATLTTLSIKNTYLTETGYNTIMKTMGDYYLPDF